MTDYVAFEEEELLRLDRLATEEGVPAQLLRSLLVEQARARPDGAAGLRGAIDSLLDAAAAEAIGMERPDAD